MPGNGTSNRIVIRYTALLVALTLTGCSTFAPEIEPVDEPEIVSAPVVVEPDQPLKVPVPELPRLPPVAIVLTSSKPAFVDEKPE